MYMAGGERGTAVDAGAAVEAARSVAGDGVRTVVSFDRKGFDVVYVDDVVDDFYEDREHMHAHYEQIHSYVNVDFTEQDLFVEELFPVAEDVRYMATGLDFSTLVRVYVGTEGLFLSLDKGIDVEAVVDAIEAVAVEA